MSRVKKDPSRVGLSLRGQLDARNALLRQGGYCERYEDFRRSWASAWGTTPDVLLRGPLPFAAALGESVRFFAPDLSPARAKAMQVARMDALQGMWVVRCAIVAQKSPNSLNQTPRVEAN